MAPLSAALANGDDTLSITADCYSTAGTDAAITAALLAYYTSSQVDTLLGDCRTGTAQDAETAGAITAALLAYYTSSQVDALLGDYRTASEDVFTTNQITSALVAYRSAADQDTATASSIAAALLSYYTIAQVDGLLAGKLGVTEAASALQIAVRFPDGRRGGGRHRRADPGPHGRLTVKLDGPPQQRLQRGPGHAHRGSKRGRLHPDPGGEPVEHRAHLQLDARARAALRLPLPARHGLQLRGVHVRGRQRLRPIVRQLRGRPGRTAKMYFTVLAPALPNQTAGTVDVYGLQILDATLEAGNTAEEDTAASALLLKHEFLDGGADDVTLATLGEVLLSPR